MPVKTAAVGLNELGMLELLHVCRTLEHHVLKQVRKPGAPFWFHAKANVVVNAYCDYGCDVIFGDDDFEAIGKFVIDHRDVQWFSVET